MDLKVVEVEFHEGSTLTCVGWLETHGVSAQAYDPEGEVFKMDADSFTIHVEHSGVAQVEDVAYPVEPGDYLVTANGVFKDGEPFTAAG